MPMTKQQIAIMCRRREREGKPPVHRIVLDGTVKLTPRRREILFHVGFTDDIRWRPVRDWVQRWKSKYIFAPSLGETDVTSIMQYLRKEKLIQYSKAGPFGVGHGAPPIMLITPRGIDALLECVGGLDV